MAPGFKHGTCCGLQWLGVITTNTTPKDYALQFWSPYYRMEIKSLESVQRSMAKMIHGLKNLPYNERLFKSLNLHSLERQEHGEI